jgi:hypothetical protein
MEPEGSLQLAQERSTCPCDEQGQSSPYHPILSIYLRLGLPSGLFPSVFPTSNTHTNRRRVQRSSLYAGVGTFNSLPSSPGSVAILQQHSNDTHSTLLIKLLPENDSSAQRSV